MTNRRNLAVATLIGVSLAVFGSGVETSSASSLVSQAPAIAPLRGYQDVWRQVYQQLPDLPLENQYVNKETGKVDPDNTLISRLIRYHLFVKGRPPMFRLDWKLTLADYLEANDLMEEGIYPASDVLRKNPLEGDRIAIQHLTRSQRNALVQVLANVFTPETSAESQPIPVAPTSTAPVQPREVPPTNTTPAPPPTSDRPSVPSQPKPGDARLLMP